MAGRRVPAERMGGEMHVGHGLVRRFALAPLGALLLPVAGQLLHDHSPNAYVPVGLTLATVILSVVTWNQAVTSRPRSDKARQALVIHSVTTTALTGVALIVICVSGFFGTVAWIYGMTGGTIVASWWIRRLAIFDTAEDVKRGGGGLDAAADLSVKTAKVIEADKSTTKVALRMGDGQSATTVRGRLDEIASSWPRRVIHGGATVKPGTYVGDAELTLRHVDKLAKPPMWPGPDRAIVGQSVCTGIVLGDYESGDLLAIYPAGNYGTPEAKAGNIIAAGNVGICGAPGSGKGVCTRIIVANFTWFRDVAPIILVDPIKGTQFLNGIRAAVGAYADTPAKIKMVKAGIRRAIHDRADALGKYGFENWESAAFTHPQLRMPLQPVLCEEFAQYDTAAFVSMSETARSVGIVMIFSAQSWKHDRVDTSMRTTVPNALCFGTVDDSAGYLLPDHVLDTGIDPQAWGSAYPGKLAANANGIPVEHFAEPARTFNAQAEDLLAVTEFFGPHMASLDPVTLAAFGDQFPYLDRPSTTELFAPPAPRSNMAPTFEESAEDLDTDDDPDGDDEDMTMPQMSDYGVDPEMAEEASAINPRLEDTGDEWEGPDVDLSDPDDTTPEMTRERKLEEFRSALEESAMAGKLELTFEEIHDAYDDRVGSRNAAKEWFLYEMIGKLIEDGQLERLSRGRYRITMLARQS